MHRLKSRDSKAMSKSPSPSTRPKETIKRERADDAILLQENTPEWQFQLYPSPTTFHTLPAEQSTEGFINRYPRLGECQSLNTFLIQYFPENEVGTRDFKMPNLRETSQACLMLRCGPKLKPLREQVDERSTEAQPLDDTYRINYMIEEPQNYPFKGRGSSYLLPPRGFSRGESLTSYIRPERASESPVITPTARHPRAELYSDTDTTPPSAYDVLVSPFSTNADTPDFKDGATILYRQWSYPKISSRSESAESLGPWLPLLTVDPNGFSSQNEFKPFLVSGLVPTSLGSSIADIPDPNAEIEHLDG